MHAELRATSALQTKVANIVMRDPSSMNVISRAEEIITTLRDALLSDEVVEAGARAHDEEDAAQRGEPSPWTHYNCSNGEESAATCPDCLEFRRERMASMNAALTAALAKIGAP